MKKSIASLITLASIMATTMANDLMTVYQDALYNDPQFRDAEAGYLADQQLKSIARADLLPTLTANANYSYTWTFEGSTTRNDGKNYGYNLVLSQSLFNLGQWFGLSKASAQAKQAEADYAAAIQALLLRVSTAYFEVLKARDLLIFTESEKIAFAEQLTNTVKRYQVGVDTLTATYEAQANYDSAVAREIQARATLAKNSEELRKLTGRIYDKLSPLTDLQLVPPEPADIETWTETAQLQNLTLIAAGVGVEVARYALREAQSGHAPSISGDVTYGRSRNKTGSNTNAHTAVGALKLTVPIFQGGKVTANSKRARLQYTQADAVRETRLRDAINDVRQAYLDVVSQMSRVQADRQTIRSRENELDAKQKQYDVGTTTLFEVLESQKELYNAQRQHAENQYDYILSGLALKQAAGILQVTDLSAINEMLSITAIDVIPAPKAEPDNASLDAFNSALAELSYTNDERHLLSIVDEQSGANWALHFDINNR